MVLQHLLLLILIHLTTIRSQITDAKLNSKCIQRIIMEYFGNTSTINIWSDEMDDLTYIKDIELPFMFIKQGQYYDKFILPNFIIHTQEKHLEIVLFSLMVTFRINKALIITKVIDDNINIMFNIMFKYVLLDVVLLVDGISPMIYTYRPSTNHNCEISTNSSIISNQYCDFQALLIEDKPIANFKNCQINILYSYAKADKQTIKSDDQFIIDKRIVSVLEGVLNVSIDIQKQVTSEHNTGRSIIQIGFLIPADYDIISGLELDEMVWIVPRGEQLTTFQIIATTYDKTMWTFILLAFVVTFLSWCLLIFLSRGDSFPRNYIDCLFVIIQFTLSISLPQLPRNNVFRFILLTYAIYSLHICTLFGANLITILTVPKFQKGISSLEELAASNITIAVVQDINDDDMFSYQKSKLQRRLHNKIKLFNNDTIRNILQKIVDHKNISLLLRQKFLPKEYDVNVIIDNAVTNPVNIGFYFPKHHHLLSIFKETILSMQESGLTNKILSNDIRKNLRKTEDNDIKLSLTHLLFAFVLLVGGLLLASLCFLIENLRARYSRKRNLIVMAL